MKTIVIDIDKFEDFAKFARAAGYCFVDVQKLDQDMLFLLGKDTPYPIIFQHYTKAGQWKEELKDILVMQATLESV